MLAVSNTSPLSNLAIINRLDLLPVRYGTIHIPPAVADELAALSFPPAKERISGALNAGWLKVTTLPPIAPVVLAYPLDPGESEAIQLALALRANVLLMDEKQGRAAVRQHGSFHTDAVRIVTEGLMKWGAFTDRAVNQVAVGWITQGKNIRFDGNQQVVRCIGELAQHGLAADNDEFRGPGDAGGGADDVFKLRPVHGGSVL